MDLYNQTSYELSRILTLRYSTSFSMSSRLFSKDIRPHIYAIYGLVRIADEIVDTYKGENAADMLNELENHTEQAMKTGYSPNPIVQSFATSSRHYNISTELTRPFFSSMRLDLTPQEYTNSLYDKYIYGSAEVIGLMCLRVFTDSNIDQYIELSAGARALGAAYQKVNFLRDIRNDYDELGRVYFPDIEFASFNNSQKELIEKDIEADFTNARSAIVKLPKSARSALMLSYDYYYALFQKIKKTDAEAIKSTRVRITDSYKLLLFARRAITL